MEGGRPETHFKEVKCKENCLVLNVMDGGGYLLIPRKYREFFRTSRIKVLFDSTNSLLALKPSEEADDYQSNRWRLWCTPFIREYSLHSQKIKVEWDEKRKFLLGKVER